MLRNYLTIALRTLRRNAGYTAINLIGLAVGLAACLLIGLYVRHELSYDTFHEKSDRIYRVVQHAQRGEESRSRLIHSARLAPAVDANLPSVEQAVRISQRWGEEILVKRGEHTFYEGNFYLADSTFLDVFGFSLRRGNPETALTEPFSVVLTERMAEKYFGKTNPIGKTIRAEGYGQMHELTVTGVAENPPSTTHLPFDFLVSFNTLRQTMPDPEDLDSWRHTAHYTYLLLEEEAQPAALERTLPKFVFRQQGRSLEELEEKGGSLSHDELQPITDIHLHSHYDRELTANSDIRYVYLFVTLALLILGLACVNYVNLATAQATRRAREVGVRKTVGAHRRQLVRQYLGESALLCAVALVGALVLARLALPVFNDLVGVQLGAHFFGPTTLLLVLGLGFVVAVGAGAYPAFYLSAFQPVEVIEGQIGTGSGRTPLRKGLVVLQFAVAVGLIAGTFLIRQQLQHMQTKELGLNEERVVVVHARDAMHQNYEAFKQELLQQSNIVGVTASGTSLPTTRTLNMVLVPEGVDQEQWMNESHPPINVLSADYDFEEVMQIPVVKGRGLSKSADSADVRPMLINNTAAEALGWENPIGKTFQCCFRPTPRVVGVVEDFHYQTLRQKIQPLVITENTYSPPYVMARVNGSDLSEALTAIRNQWQQVSDAPFEYSFLDQRFEQVYRAERRTARVFTIFAGLAIFIACLGLLGLSAYAAKQREKEIGIRKTLGATATNIVALLSKEFLLLVGIACVIAAPVAYVGMERWLRDFAYRVDVSPWLFVGASVLAALIAFLTISYQAFRAARTDPAQTLRDE